MGILTHLLLPRRYGDRRRFFIPPNPQPNLENGLRRPTADPPQPVPGPSPTHVAEARRLMPRFLEAAIGLARNSMPHPGTHFVFFGLSAAIFYCILTHLRGSGV